MHGQMQSCELALGGAPASELVAPWTFLHPSGRLPVSWACVLVFPALSVPSHPELASLITSPWSHSGLSLKHKYSCRISTWLSPQLPNSWMQMDVWILRSISGVRVWTQDPELSRLRISFIPEERNLWTPAQCKQNLPTEQQSFMLKLILLPSIFLLQYDFI